MKCNEKDTPGQKQRKGRFVKCKQGCRKSIIHKTQNEKAEQKYRGMFEIQKSGNKTSSGEIGLNFTLVGCWSSVYIRRIIYKFLNVCPFDYTAVAVSGKVGYP